MLRIIFTAEDLARTRVATGPDPLWEITNSVQTLQRRDGRAVFGVWRRAARNRISADSRKLAHLLPPHGYSPDFLTPSIGGGRLAAAVDAVLSTPRRRLDTDLGRLAASRSVPLWVGRLAQGHLSSLDTLGTALHTYQAEALTPYWPRIRAHVEADSVVRRHTLRTRGAHGLLAGFGPHIRWRPPVLEVDYPVSQTLCLDGRGLTLQPSYFCWPTPVSLLDPALPPVLVYPVLHDVRPGPERRQDPLVALSALMGPVRAGVLVSARIGRTTGELARHLAVSNPAVSQHTSVLRNAGLLITVRQGGRALHVTTAQGRALIDSAEYGSL
ncbi:ArsR family transcriptional regulator [Streptomyces ipomoeae]|jgi:hypothetical protein|uniref:Transcriptional regulator, ArsR family n=1 Tax=Streptomyces ipomoeae 91-03 TaxID=698759 RepID=L1KUN1_9ACTN|nr:ArsR family transcriptional regulator [Streptomyces ipomoeae]EKX64516.1 transcriptional regulator, ArsR family [Streptomyces ipomoeae 91-03]MDX2699210.1 ArsR family transcriptional regulator [Streptomyces ipomoeae]MDX2826630.1 ArsR family transcriptional regulator [Streptomyces ipomoeae]MDX2844650.1 ArsR family transcriptional regulator [Streptomyces ipomoeae]MDX2879279.1 ArsR family transcriptional regulator [Streptomyces ipomoeae]